VQKNDLEKQKSLFIVCAKGPVSIIFIITWKESFQELSRARVLDAELEP